MPAMVRSKHSHVRSAKPFACRPASIAGAAWRGFICPRPTISTSGRAKAARKNQGEPTWTFSTYSPEPNPRTRGQTERRATGPPREGHNEAVRLVRARQERARNPGADRANQGSLDGRNYRR